jgi:hypothetical protein
VIKGSSTEPYVTCIPRKILVFEKLEAYIVFKRRIKGVPAADIIKDIILRSKLYDFVEFNVNYAKSKTNDRIDNAQSFYTLLAIVIFLQGIEPESFLTEHGIEKSIPLLFKLANEIGKSDIGDKQMKRYRTIGECDKFISFSSNEILSLNIKSK